MQPEAMSLHISPLLSQGRTLGEVCQFRRSCPANILHFPFIRTINNPVVENFRTNRIRDIET